jgi:hypothetical protein
MPISHPVFVIMPLGRPDHIRRVYEDGISPALTQLGFTPVRVDDSAVRGGIVDAIQGHIARAYFVIADLSHERPNCYFELGYAQALGKPALLLSGEGTRVHFNVADQMVHMFRKRQSVRRLIHDLVPEFLETRDTGPDDDKNGQFGRRCIVDGFRLMARVTESTRRTCKLTFEVIGLTPGTPLTGSVSFHLHYTYRRSVQHITARRGVARYEEVSCHDGPWTLGAIVGPTGTRLELDLSTIPGAPDWWYRKAYETVRGP